MKTLAILGGWVKKSLSNLFLPMDVQRGRLICMRWILQEYMT